MIINNHKAVSYTHLDVYKRQVEYTESEGERQTYEELTDSKQVATFDYGLSL